jgi:hypothetical protein
VGAIVEPRDNHGSPDLDVDRPDETADMPDTIPPDYQSQFCPVPWQSVDPDDTGTASDVHQAVAPPDGHTYAMLTGSSATAAMKRISPEDLHLFKGDRGSDQKELKGFKDRGAYVRVLASDLPAHAEVLDLVCLRQWKPAEPHQGGVRMIDRGDGVKVMCKPKTRAVVLGNFEKAEYVSPINAPSVLQEELRCALALVAQRQQGPEEDRFTVCSKDVSQAFLQSSTQGFTRCIAVRPPPEAGEEPGVLWYLRKYVYGLKGSPGGFHRDVVALMQKHGFQRVHASMTTYVMQGDGNSNGVCVWMTDDCLLCGNAKLRAAFAAVEADLEFGRSEETAFKHCGLRINQKDDGSVEIHQDDYVDALQPVKYSKADEDGLTPSVATEARGLFGAMCWVSLATAPHISCRISLAGQDLARMDLKWVKRLNETLKVLKHTPGRFIYSSHTMKRPVLVCEGDAAFGNLRDGGSQGGFIISLRDWEGDNSYMLSHESKRIKRVVFGSLGAESKVQIRSMDRIKWIQQLWSSMTGVTIPIVMKSDCYSLVEASHSLANVNSHRALTKEVYGLREALKLEEVLSLSHTPGKDALADGMTKDYRKGRERIWRAQRGVVSDIWKIGAGYSRWHGDARKVRTVLPPVSISTYDCERRQKK